MGALQDVSIVVLAAGEGKRMRSRLPKVLHPLAGRPLLAHVLETALALSSSVFVVYGFGGRAVPEAMAGYPVHFVEQPQPLGTGDALHRALPLIPGHHRVMVLYGDVPMIRKQTLEGLLEEAGQGLGILTVHLPDPSGYGRILRKGGEVWRIVEERDADAEALAVEEVNTGIMAAPKSLFEAFLPRLSSDNAQGEFYLTDCIAMAVEQGIPVVTLHPDDPFEVMGVNDRLQLAELERRFQLLQARRLMEAGVTLLDPHRLDIRGRVQHGLDVVIDANVVLEGEVRLGDGVRIGAGAVLRDVELGDDVEVLPYSVMEGVIVEAGCRIGPFARLRPGTLLGPGVHIGNFVEVKKSSVGEGSKINHLSYVGDATVGKRVNIGAGTITCNYDGARKHPTVIEDDAFIGSDTQLVAPVRVGKGATIGAGSTITRDAPAGELTLSRSPQTTRPGWKRPRK